MQSRSHLVALAILLAVLPLDACLSGVDFDSIEPECEEPAFDVRSRDAYCSGEYLGTQSTGIVGESTQLIGLDKKGEQILVVAGEQPHPTGLSFDNYRLWLVDDQRAGDLFTLDPDVGTFRDLSPLAESYAPTILKAQLLSVKHKFAVLTIWGALIPVFVDPAAAQFDPLWVGVRSPPVVDDGGGFFIDVAALQVGDELKVFASMVDRLKVMSFVELDAGGLVEQVPQLTYARDPDHPDDVATIVTYTDGLPDPSLAVALLMDPPTVNPPSGEVLGAWGRLVERYGVNAGCATSQQCRFAYADACLSYCFAIPMIAIGVDPVIRQDVPLLYAGGGGQVDLYDIKDIVPRLDPPTPIDSFLVAPASGDYGLMTLDIKVEGDLLIALMLGGADVTDESFDRGEVPVNLVIVRLAPDGSMERLLSNTPLPRTLKSSLFFNLEKMGNLVAVKANTLAATEIMDEFGKPVLLPGDVRVAVLDIADPSAPQLISENLFEHLGNYGMTGLASAQAEMGQVPLVPTPGGLVTIQVSVDGEPTP